ncbi:hypothetical protein RSAG8_12625, partial [Rhizoctonia solani AG-8 WAC10335]
MESAQKYYYAPNPRSLGGGFKNWKHKNFTRTPGGSSSPLVSPRSPQELVDQALIPGVPRKLKRPDPGFRPQVPPDSWSGFEAKYEQALWPGASLAPETHSTSPFLFEVPSGITTHSRRFASIIDLPVIKEEPLLEDSALSTSLHLQTEPDSAQYANPALISESTSPSAPPAVEESRLGAPSRPSLRLEIPTTIYIDRHLFAPINPLHHPLPSNSSPGHSNKPDVIGPPDSMITQGSTPDFRIAAHKFKMPPLPRGPRANNRTIAPVPSANPSPLPPAPASDVDWRAIGAFSDSSFGALKPRTKVSSPPSQLESRPALPLPEPQASPSSQIGTAPPPTRFKKDKRERPPLISRSMTVQEVVVRLVAHGCHDLSNSVKLSTFGEHPVSHGGFSDVYCGNLRDGSRVAIKSLRISLESLNQNPTHLKHADPEIHTWSKCRHPNVIPLLGLALFRGRIGMVSPWMGQGTLPYYLKRIPDANRHSLCVQICEGLAYLHRIGIVHADLKGANVLVSDEGNAVLTDFGNSLLADQTMKFTQTTSSASMTVRWSAAELIAGTSPATKASDVYALGMTVLETISGMISYHGKQDVTIMLLVTVKKQPPERPECIPNGCKNGERLWELLLGCWAYEPGERPSAEQVTATLRTITREGSTS